MDRMDIMEQGSDHPDGIKFQAQIDAMNNCKAKKQFLPRLTPQELQLGEVYSAEIIKKIQTKYGVGLVLENESFSMFLPRKYLNVDIIEEMPRRCFQITGYHRVNGRDTPNLHFSLRPQS